MRYIDYYKQDSLAFVRKCPSEFVDLTLHRTWWFWDGSLLIYWTREWWKPWEFWPLSVLGWLSRSFFCFPSILLSFFGGRFTPEHHFDELFVP